MAVAKFNWHGTNPNKSFQTEYPPKSYFPQMCKLNATKEETEAAYNALANHGKVSDFKVKVWNDICAKAYDLCQEWDIHGNEIKVEVWSPFMHVDDRAVWIALAQKTWGWSEWEAEEWTDNNLYPNWKPGVFQAEYYNVLYGSWLLPVGLQKFQVRKGQPVKGEYILRLVEIINHWTELSPMDVRVILVFRSAEQNSTVLLPSCPVNPDCLEMYFTLRDGTRLDDSLQIHITLDLNMLMEKMSITELTSCPLSSLINFMRMDIRCKIWDKVPIYISVDLRAFHEGAGEPVYVDGTKLYMHFDYELKITLYFRQTVAQGVTVHWGDGESSVSSTSYGSSNLSTILSPRLRTARTRACCSRRPMRLSGCGCHRLWRSCPRSPIEMWTSCPTPIGWAISTAVNACSTKSPAGWYMALLRSPSCIGPIRSFSAALWARET